MKAGKLLLLILLFAGRLSWAQDDSGQSKFGFKGYLKNMSSFNYTGYLGDTLWYENLTHNRLNFAWYPNDNFSAYLEIRNRLYTGAYVKNIPGYGGIINSNNDYFDWSANLVDNNSVVLNTAIDRAFIDWVKNDWEVKLGRQRINWGVNLAWNPNDWFNAYSFFDFDYEERPGSDALRVIRYTGVASSVEVAAKAAKDMGHFVAAGLWKINKWNYDIQFLGGIAQGDLALGTGWAGNLGKASFKGELTYFNSVVDTEVNKDYNDMFLGAISVDYSFPNSLYLNGSVMYNNQGQKGANFGFTLIGQQYGTFTVRDLSPYLWSSFVQASYQITPLLYGGMAVIVFPGSSDALFINPTITFSVVQNLDLDVIGQLYYDNNTSGYYDAISKSIFARVKWSF